MFENFKQISYPPFKNLYICSISAEFVLNKNNVSAFSKKSGHRKDCQVT